MPILYLRHLQIDPILNRLARGDCILTLPTLFFSLSAVLESVL